ncbi:hypothetical protein ABBQ38_014830 [Trebouxia sp. C0009 RCD-2024]
MTRKEGETGLQVHRLPDRLELVQVAPSVTAKLQVPGDQHKLDLSHLQVAHHQVTTGNHPRLQRLKTELSYRNQARKVVQEPDVLPENRSSGGEVRCQSWAFDLS